jgi:ferritin
MLFMEYLQQNGEKVVLDAIAKPDIEFKEFIDPLKAGAEHERYVTSLIHDIYAAAYDNRDFRTMQFLDWFVKEQAEEEDNADSMVSRFELFGSDAKGLYMLDSELAGRVYTAPSLTL